MKSWRTLPALMLVVAACSLAGTPQDDPPLRRERVMVLPDTKGRIDHLAIDLAGSRLFVAEVANGTVDTIDLVAGKVVHRIQGLTEPQGVAWLAGTGELVVGCGDGSVRFYGEDGQERASLDLGEDADNVRIDSRNGHVVVGYGKGGLAVIDPVRHVVLGRLALPGHPEGFRLDGARAYINLPDRGAVVAADIDRGRILATWPTGLHRLNFPMAIQPSGRAIAIAYRLPSALAWIDTATGRSTSIRSACGDADDLFLVGNDALLVCGAGHVDLISPTGSKSVPTAGGARTGLYVPELGTLFLAVPARQGPAAIWALKLQPSKD